MQEVWGIVEVHIAEYRRGDMATLTALVEERAALLALPPIPVPEEARDTTPMPDHFDHFAGSATLGRLSLLFVTFK